MRNKTLGTFGLTKRHRLAFFAVFTFMFFISSCAIYKPLPINNIQINKKTSVIDKKAIEKMPQGHVVLSKLLNKKPLNENDIADLALNLNPQLKIEKDKLYIAKAQIGAAKEIPNPTISTDVVLPVAGNIANTYDGYSIGFSYPINWILSHSAKVKSAVLDYEAQKLNYNFSAYQVMQDAKIKAANVYYLEKILKETFDKEKQYYEIYSIIKSAYNQRLVSLSDLQLAKNEYEDAKIQYLDVKNLFDKEKNNLNSILGLPVSLNIKVNITLNNNFNLPPLEKLYSNIPNRLDIVAYKLAYKAQQEKTRMAFAQQFPRISISLPFSHDTSDVQTLGFGVSIDFPIFSDNKAQIDLQEATQKKMYDEYVSRIITAKFDIKRLISNIENIRSQLTFLREDYGNSSKLLEYYKRAYKKGDVSILEYYKNSNGLIDKRIKILNLENSLYAMGVALEIASAQKLNLGTE